MIHKIDEKKMEEGAHEILKGAINKLESVLDLGMREHLRGHPKNSISSLSSFTKYVEEKFSEVYMKRQEAVRGIIKLKDYFEDANKVCYNKIEEYIQNSKK